MLSLNGEGLNSAVKRRKLSGLLRRENADAPPLAKWFQRMWSIVLTSKLMHFIIRVHEDRQQSNKIIPKWTLFIMY